MPVTLELRLAGVLGQKVEDGVSEDVQDGEGEERDPEDHHDELGELAGDVETHQVGTIRRPSPRGARGAGSADATSFAKSR